MPDSKKITTPEDGHEIEMIPYLTGRVHEAIQGVYFEAMEMKGNTESPEGAENNFNLKGTAVLDARHIQIEHLIISVDGEKEKILDKVLDMKLKDYEFVVGEIDKLVQEDEGPSKKGSQ